VLDPTGAWIDAARAAAHYVVADPVDTCRRLVEQVTGQARQAVTPGDWLDGWQEAESAAARSIAATLQAEGDGDPAQPTTEPGTARAVAAGLPDGGHMVVSSSMPVRDVEWFAAPRVGWRVHANRGANGIDGVVSTAVGVALASGAPTTALLGDLAFLHDSNALLGLRHRPVDLTVVVVDNHGGGIFSFLPQAAALDSARFEQLFGTPQDVDVAGLAAAHGIPVLATLAEARAASGVRLVVVPTDRARNVDVHDRIHAAVVQAIDG
jgi:2-succinyl-5-enolpyruvyl-6-hydroxy-3-cyclohexene-1-carboxylate synthase